MNEGEHSDTFWDAADCCAHTAWTHACRLTSFTQVRTSCLFGVAIQSFCNVSPSVYIFYKENIPLCIAPYIFQFPNTS